MQPSNILRVVLPKLSKQKIQWKGWHGFPRGVATELHRNGVSDFVIQKALRHGERHGDAGELHQDRARSRH